MATPPVAVSTGAARLREPVAAGEYQDAPVCVRCFGALEISAYGRPVGEGGGAGQYAQAREVLALLASHPAGGVSKEKVLAALWPDSSSERGAAA